MPAKRLRPGLKEPYERRKARAFVARLVNFAIRARDEIFQEAPRFRLRRIRGELGEISGGAFVEFMEALHFFERHLRIRLHFDAVEHLFEFGPDGPLVGDELLQVDDHRSCLCLTSMYWATIPALKRSFSSSEKRTARRCNTFCNSRRLC